MTQMTVTFELQEPLRAEQLRALGAFANTYGIHRFDYKDHSTQLSVDYDASRLRETVVEQVLRKARIPILRRLAPVN